jgi:hypothetical protein
MGANNNSLLSGSTGYEDPYSTNTPLNDLEKQLQEILMQQQFANQYNQPQQQQQQSSDNTPSSDTIQKIMDMFKGSSGTTANFVPADMSSYMALGAGEQAAWGYPVLSGAETGASMAGSTAGSEAMAGMLGGTGGAEAGGGGFLSSLFGGSGGSGGSGAATGAVGGLAGAGLAATMFGLLAGLAWYQNRADKRKEHQIDRYDNWAAKYMKTHPGTFKQPDDSRVYKPEPMLW